MYRRRCDCELRIQRTDHCLMCVCVWWETHATCVCSAMLIPRKCNNSHAPFVTEAVRVHFPELLTGTETKMNDVCWLQRLQQAQHQPTKQQQKNRHQNVNSWIGAHFQMLQLWYFTRWRMPLSQPPQQCAAHSRNMLVERQKTCYQTTVKNHQLRVDRTYYSSNGNEDLFASSTQLMWFVPFQCLYTLRPECATKATRIFDDDGDDDDDASLCLSVGLATVATCQNSFAGLFELRC